MEDKIPAEYLAMYIGANAFALGALALAFWHRPAARWVACGLFAWAAAVNGYTAVTHPRVYLDYATLTPSAWYRDFILGWFSSHVRPMVIAIAAGQAVIALLLALADSRAQRLGAAGAITFLLAIAPLGVGSGFPFSVVFSACVLVAVGADELRSPRLRQWVIQAPRLVGGAVVVLLGAFALDAFGRVDPLPLEVLRFFRHLAPAAIAAAVLAIGWRWRWTGGVMCFVAAVVYAAMSQGRISWMLVIALPLVVEGALFLWSSRLALSARLMTVT